MSRSKDPSRSEIVADIREMLENTVDLIQNVPAAKSPFRARATRHVTDRAQGRGLDTMNKYEQASVRALMAWAANEQKAPPETVKAATEVRFGVEDVTHIQRRDYEDVVKFLIDLRLDEMKN
jgi:hypothetical protein